MVRTDSLFARVLSILFSLVLLGFIEAGIRIVAPRDDRMDEILAILRQDPSLIWRVRERIDVQFQGRRVKTNALGLRNVGIPPRRPGSLRVVCMGESLTFGWGVDEAEAYPRVLERLLQGRVPAGERVEVINAGQVGYSSLQGLRFFERVIAPLAPDIITVPYVINDVDTFRFFRSDGRSDAELTPGSAALLQVENVLRHSALFRWMAAEARRLRSGYGPLPRGAVRVSENEYEHNLRSLVRAARARGVFVVFLKMPVNLPSMPVLSPWERQRSGELLADGKALLEKEDFAAAVQTLENAGKINPYDGDVFAALGTAYAKRKDFASARRAWARAKDCEAYRCRERAEQYHRIMERVAASEKVPLADIVALFSRYGASYAVDLFNDPRNDRIHPNPRGHGLIAAGLAKVIGENYAVPSEAGEILQGKEHN